MEEQQQETKFCSNCKKDIPANNFMMHVPHCQRNITLCDQCQEPVPKSQLDEHFEEHHEKVKCECGESMEKMHLDEHKEMDCKSRKTTCEYCNLECTLGNIDSHKEYCGSRTELCEKCNQRIQHRDLEEHSQSDCTLNNNEPNANNNASNASGGLQNGLSRTLPETMVRNFGFGDIDDIGLAGGPEAFHRLITSGFGTLPVGDIFEQDQFYDNRDHMFSSNVLPRSNVIARGPSSNRRPREQRRERNNQLMDNRTRSDNSVATRPDLENDELLATLLACDDDDSLIDGGSYAGYKEPLPGINHLHDNQDTDDEDYQDEDLDETMLPCEFCGKPVKAQDLIQHQTGCQLVLSGSPSLFPQLRSQPRSLPPIDPTYSDDDQEQNGAIEPHDQTFLPCEFCQDLFPSDSLIGHQSICDPDRSRPPSSFQTFQGAFFESDQHGLNNSLPTRTRPPRPSRPVVTTDSSDEQDLDLFNPVSDLRPSRRVTSNDEGRSALFHPTGEIIPLRETYPNEDDNRRKNNNNSSSRNNNSSSSRNNSTSSKSRSGLVSGNSRSQRNNEVRCRRNGPPSHSVPLTVRNGQVSQGAVKTQGSRKSTAPYLSQSSRVTSDNEKGERKVASTHKATTSSRHVESCSGVQESGKYSLKNDDEVSAVSVNGRHRNGTRREGSEDELPWEMRPLQETGPLPLTSANQRQARKGVSSGGHAFQHNIETRKQMSRLAPSFDKPPSSTDSRRDGAKNLARGKDKIASSRRFEERTSAPDSRDAQSASGRPSSSTKPKTKKKIV